jgi:hypothetical protein
VEAGLAAIARDREHGAGYLARKALGVLALTPADERHGMAARLEELRPDMPAIAAAVLEAAQERDIRAVIRRADAERRRIARAAARSLHRRRVATLSNSALVARALVYGGPAITQVVVAGRDDEGWALAADLRAAGLAVEVTTIDEVQAELAVVGCEAVFNDGSFVARTGTRALIERMPALVLVDRWKRIDAPPPSSWPSPRHELVPGGEVRAPA